MFKSQIKYHSISLMFGTSFNLPRMHSFSETKHDHNHDHDHQCGCGSDHHHHHEVTEANQHYINGINFFNEGRLEECVNELQTTIELDPTIRDPHLVLGCALNFLGKHQDAYAVYEKAIELFPGDSLCYGAWGNLLLGMKEYENAVSKLQKAIELDPQVDQSYLDLGTALYHLERIDEAMEEFRKGVEVNPKFTDVYVEWSKILLEVEKYEEAIEKISKAAELEPEDARISLVWGNALYKFGKSKAKADQSQQIESAIPSDHPEAISTKIFGEAAEKFLRAVKTDPSLIESHFLLGLAIGKLKRYEEAINAFKVGFGKLHKVPKELKEIINDENIKEDSEKVYLQLEDYFAARFNV